MKSAAQTMLQPEQQDYKEGEEKMKQVKEARLKAGLTQQQMSDLLGIPKRTIEEWEGGRRRCPGYTQKMIVEELKRMSRVRERKK